MDPNADPATHDVPATDAATDEGQLTAPSIKTLRERMSPIRFRIYMQDGLTYLAATIRLFGSSVMDSHAFHVGRILEDGEDAESPTIRAELRKGLSALIADNIVNDQWGAK